MDQPNCLSPEDGVETMLKHAGPPAGREQCAAADALGRVAGADVAALLSQPPFDRSALDGYAVHHLDIRGASPQAPVRLEVAGRRYAGDPLPVPLNRGQALRIMTGAPMPKGATCVVRQEDTVEEGDRVRVERPVGAGEGHCLKGEDVEKGEVILSKGQRLNAAHLAVLAGQGVGQIEAYALPAVGVLSIGNELTPPGQPLAEGKIYDANGCYLGGRIGRLGARAVPGGVAEDEPQGLARAIAALLEQADFVVTTGAVSVGERDYVPAAARLLGGTALFEGIGVKPGSPAKAYTVGEKLLLCLSGNPFAAAATFELLAVPVIKKLCGQSLVDPIRVSSTLREGYSKPSPCRRFVRGLWDGKEIRLPRGNHASGSMATMGGCNCLVDIPAGSPPLEPGCQVQAVLLASWQ